MDKSVLYIKSILHVTPKYGTPKGTCAIFRLGRGHDLLGHSNDLLARDHDTLSRSLDLLSRGHEVLSRFDDIIW